MNLPIPNPEIRALLELVDQFAIIKRVEYYDPDSCRFVSKVLLALRAAEPEIRRLATLIPPVRFVVHETHEQANERERRATTPSPSPETAATPNNAAPPAPTQASSSHNPAAILNTADTDATVDRELDNPGKPASVSATAASALAKPITRPKAAPRATGPAQPRTRPAVPPPAPPATPPSEPS